MTTMKGQYFSFDAVIASIIFVLALTALLSYWNSTKNTFDLQDNDMAKEALRISDQIFTPGSPEGKACGAQEKIGYAVSWTDQRLKGIELDCASDYFTTADSLKAPLSTRFGVSIYVDNGQRVKVIGGGLPSTTKNVVKLRRVASVINGLGTEELTNIDVYVYQ